MEQSKYSQYAALYDDFNEPRSLFAPYCPMGAMSSRQALENVMNSPALKDWERRLKEKGTKVTHLSKHRQD